jgi:DNA-binding CsgD family transcriptional regulator
MTHEVAANGNGFRTSLTGREHEVLRLIARGHTSPEIAGELSIAPSTARNHKYTIYGVLGVNNRFQAALVGLDREELQPREVLSGRVLLRLPRLERRKGLRQVLETMRTNLGAYSHAEDAAAELGLSPKTVKNHQAAICDLLDTRIVPAVVNYHLIFAAPQVPTDPGNAQQSALGVPVLTSV